MREGAMLLGALLLLCGLSWRCECRSIKIPVSTIFQRSKSSSVPKLVHQSWKTAYVPKYNKEWQESWKAMHPHWTYTLWTDEMNRKMVEDHFRWFLPIYDEFPREILRADSARYMYMYQYGGVYADLDFRALKPMDGLFNDTGPHAYLGRITEDDTWQHNIPNAWMASSPGHPFWMFCLMEIARASTWLRCDANDCTRGYQVERTTGPWMLWRAVRFYEYYGKSDEGSLTVLPAGIIYPLNWREFDGRCGHWGDNETACYTLFPESYAITYWSHSW